MGQVWQAVRPLTAQQRFLAWRGALMAWRSRSPSRQLLVIAESTAKTHVKRVLAKGTARDHAQAVVLAYRAGLMSRAP